MNHVKKLHGIALKNEYNIKGGVYIAKWLLQIDTKSVLKE